MRLKRFDKWTPVVVFWNDSQGGDSGWHKIRKKEREVSGCVTVGQVESQDTDRVTLVMSRDDVNKHVDGVLTIPLTAITEVREL